MALDLVYALRPSLMIQSRNNISIKLNFIQRIPDDFTQPKEDNDPLQSVPLQVKHLHPPVMWTEIIRRMIYLAILHLSVLLFEVKLQRALILSSPLLQLFKSEEN
jgi:hypothetical protein